MSLYRMIYAPDGEPFEVPPERADQLVLNRGWTNTPPPPPKARPKTRRVRQETESEEQEEPFGAVAPDIEE